MFTVFNYLMLICEYIVMYASFMSAVIGCYIKHGRWPWVCDGS